MKKNSDKPRQPIRNQRHHFAEVYIVKAIIFPTVMYKYEIVIIKKKKILAPKN